MYRYGAIATTVVAGWIPSRRHPILTSGFIVSVLARSSYSLDDWSQTERVIYIYSTLYNKSIITCARRLMWQCIYHLTAGNVDIRNIYFIWQTYVMKLSGQRVHA